MLEDRYRRHDGTEKDQDQKWKTLLMMCMEDAPATREKNNDDLNWSSELRAQK